MTCMNQFLFKPGDSNLGICEFVLRCQGRIAGSDQRETKTQNPVHSSQRNVRAQTGFDSIVFLH